MSTGFSGSSPRLTRRDVFRLGGLAAAATVPGLTACAGQQTGSGDGSTLQEFEAQHSGTTVQPIHVPGDYATKVNTLVASNRMPDVAYMDAPTAYRLAEQTI